jgi:hypothetical protein
MIPVLRLISGAAIAFFGRKLYWFSIGAVGFFASLDLTRRFFDEQTLWLAILLALIAGAVGAFLAVTIQKIAIGLTGFLLGGFLLLQILLAFDLTIEGWRWLVFLVGGLLGMALLSALFEWSLILLTAVVGALLMSDPALLPEGSRLLIFALSLLLGLGVQITTRLNEIRRDG